MFFDDLTPVSATTSNGTAASSNGSSADGWDALIRLAEAFPLESLSFREGAPAEVPHPLPVASHDAVPEQVSSYEGVLDLVYGRGDGPLIGLGTGSSPALAGSP
jgi:hypothetical protein